MILLCCPQILPYLTHIINHCLEFGVFPDNWKRAIIYPIPKIKNPFEFKDLRPISVLPTLSKLLERVVEQQIREHISQFDILPDIQSGFRKMHSCETALLGITDDIFRGTDQGLVTVLVLLDFSKAFDTLNHDMLLAILKYFRFGQTTITFFQNYFENRYQSVKICQNLSSPLEISSGVPQGSILGPLLYTLYTSNFNKYISSCSMHLYADDTQIYRSFCTVDIDAEITRINADVSALVKVSKDHALNINAKKSSVLVFGPVRNRLVVLPRINIHVDGQQITPTDSAKNLGLTFDYCLRFKPHINNCLRTAYANLKAIYNNRHYLNPKIKTILCESLVLSRFNFCDSVYGPCLDASDKRRIQVIQNSCLRLIFGIRRRHSISHKLVHTGWLNMSNRRRLHSACLFHKIVINKTPSYLSRKITYRSDVHNVNVRFKGSLTPPQHRTEFFKRSFSYQITNIYNGIPSELKNLTHLQFKKSFKNRLLVQQNMIP